MIQNNNELLRQQQFMDKIKIMNEEVFLTTGKRPQSFIRTYGCQMNERDSEKIAGILDSMGYLEAASEKNADLVIYNTCCIRENAENKVFGNLGRLKYYKERKKDMKIALCGCMVQQKEVADLVKSKYRQVDLLFGTHNFHRLPELLCKNLSSGKPVYDVWESPEEIVEDFPTLRKYKWKAGVNIMYGCDNFCSYCIVPYVRGRERSREPIDIVNEIKAFRDDGVKEILLLGQNVNSYGKNLAHKKSFAELLSDIGTIRGIERIRFMTPHPKDFSDELINVIATSKKVCSHVHLPLQSGSSRILAAMNRKYTKEHYLSLVDRIKSAIPDVSITTDIIVGFPTETEEDFLDTLDVLKQVRFSGAFTFIYSRRSGTPAEKMIQLSEEVVNERFERLLEVQNQIVFEENEAKVSNVYPVLADSISRKDKTILSGRTEGNTLVHFEGGENLLGEIVNVRIEKNRAFFLEGRIAKQED